MKILSIKIKEFGGLSDKSFSLGDGINIFEGENESGKSTVLSFIKFIFYGLPKRTSGGALSERDRCLSWANGVADGSLTLENGEGQFRIERRGVLQSISGKESYRESIRIIDLAAGNTVLAGVHPGEHFLGMPVGVFESTAFIKQLECSIVDGVEVETALENILFSASESINVQKSIDKLEAARRPILHKSEKGGRLFELALEKSELESRLIEAKKASEEIIKKSAEVDDIRKKLEKLIEENNTLDSKRRRSSLMAVLKRFDELHSCEKSVTELEEQLEALKATYGFSSVIPERNDLNEISGLREEIGLLQNQHMRETLELRELTEHDSSDSTLVSFAQAIRNLGGKQSVTEKLRSLSSSKNAFLTLGSIGNVLGVLSLCSVAAVFASTSEIIIPIILASLGVILGAAGIVFLLLGGKKKASRKELLSLIGVCDEKLSSNEISEYIDKCFDEEMSSSTLELKISATRNSLASLDKEISSLYGSAVSKLKRFGYECDESDRQGVLKQLAEAKQDIGGFCEQRERILGELHSKKQYCAMLTSSLAEFNEAAISARVPADADEANESAEELDARYNFNQSKIKALDEKRISLEKALMVLEKTSDNPIALSAELELLQNDYNQNKLYADALMMAKECLEKASSTLKSSVTPAIRESASHYISLLTDGKYNEIGIGEEMQLNITADDATRPIDAMSKGTKDAAYISLRVALLDYVSKNHQLPIFLDESLTQLDNTRAKNALDMLNEYSKNGHQVLLFTCHTRESELLDGSVAYNKIKL